MTEVAIIGAGPSGLVSAKSHADRGLNPHVFEKSLDLGGFWVPGRGAMWEGLLPNISKNNTCFSDYPHSSNTPQFQTVGQMNEYLRSYARAFGIEKKIQYECEVIEAVPLEKKWQIKFREKNREHTALYDHLVVSSGFFSKGFVPKIEGIKNFAGPMYHSAAYRDRERFWGMDVVVYGNSFSGLEICSDLAEFAASVTQVVKRPVWILPRYVTDKKFGPETPIDLVLYRRSSLDNKKSSSIQEKNQQRNRYLSSLSKQNEFDIPEVYIDPESRDFIPAAISDNYCKHVKDGRIKIVPENTVKKFCNQGIQLSNDQVIKGEVVIFATGFKFKLPFFSNEVKEKLEFMGEDQLQPAILFKETLHAGLPNLAFVGAYKGPYFGVMELQARLAAEYFESGNFPVSDEEYQKGIEEEQRIRKQVPRPQFPHGNYVEFSDSLAKLAHCYPEITETDPLKPYIETGPVIPSHYRISGKDSKRDVAEKTIIDLNTSYFPKREK